METASPFWTALAWVLVIEGVTPFLFPGGWRRAIGQLAHLRDGQVRFFGLVLVLVGSAALWLLS